MFNRLIVGSSVLLSALCVFAFPKSAVAAADFSHSHVLLSQNPKDEGVLPLDTPLLFSAFDYNNHFLGSLGLTTTLDWNLLPWEFLYLSAFKEVYLEDAGQGKVYIRSGQAYWEGYDYVVISPKGYLLLGNKKYAEAFTVIAESNPFNPNQKIYEFFDRNYRGIGTYGKYITVGPGTRPTVWNIVRKL
ncbi:hypothetical protein AALM99_09955 [Lactococcus muris]|uniref:Uncharacterized protein n=1 Tax=Lactococcus muris TaxID=2941330 RepID=A0ABV4DDQ8_9LACT|nr:MULTISPECIES: hypothetical protein [Lactococcus]